MFLQIPETDIGDQDGKYKQNRRTDYQRQKRKVKGRRPVCGYHHADADAHGQSPQRVGRQQGAAGIIQALIDEHTPKLPFGHADALYHSKFFLPGDNRRQHGINKVQNAHKGNNQADGKAHNGVCPGLLLIMPGQGGFRGIVQGWIHIVAVVDQHFFRLRLVFLCYIKEQLPQSVVRVHRPERICRKIERKEILCTAVDTLGDGGYICHNRHHFILLPVQFHHIPYRIGRLSFFLAVLRAGGGLHHHIAPGQELIRLKGAVQNPAILREDVQDQPVNAVQNRSTFAAFNHVMVGFGQPCVRCFYVGQPVVRIVIGLDIFKSRISDLMRKYLRI